MSVRFSVLIRFSWQIFSFEITQSERGKKHIFYFYKMKNKFVWNYLFGEKMNHYFILFGLNKSNNCSLSCNNLFSLLKIFYYFSGRFYWNLSRNRWHRSTQHWCSGGQSQSWRRCWPTGWPCACTTTWRTMLAPRCSSSSKQSNSR